MDDSNAVKAWSVGIGIFFGISPFWGFQTALVILFTHLFKLNKAIAILSSNISIPPAIPVIVAGSLHVGAVILNERVSIPRIHAEMEWSDLGTQLSIYLVGSFVLALISGLTAGLITYTGLNLRKRKSHG